MGVTEGRLTGIAVQILDAEEIGKGPLLSAD